ncbi:hypothetical protein [Endozoicomonas sp. SCSIO W0465]|uniref:hypothetical protein n=1 Tax=Endozoicomonas sp. SCSIO W0465 TaxID=2918516 RepID=UPI002074C3F0|nr:hypothetical protein [Endozoicomonas sp. SCSIO W0465]USE38744.1 hypothetical protein MJO57_11560 [Endozoicomonas sp. SCSIO W0465]
MQTGLNLLTGVDEKSKLAREAFRLANMAMLTQQKHTFREPRHSVVKAGKAVFPEFQLNSGAGGQWRAFQIGFLLMSIASCVNREDRFREDVDLIWFPTGGGKTEAYLALTAFTLFYDRLAKGEDCFGVQVLMRYTLRLLTTQQFTRAATLICAMENLRQQRGDLGDQPYSIGLWVGGANTPNTHLGAQDDLKRLQSGKGENRFLLNKCPWCAAAMGPSQKKGKARKQLTPGYKKSGDGISLHCPDSKCDFSHQLPVMIVDEDIYQQRPSLLIGTVDKFAQLSWRSDVRRLFGIDQHGKRQFLR